MRSPRLSYRALFSLYGASALTLLPFALMYAYASKHGADHGTALVLCLSIGVIMALVVWAWLEPKLVHQPLAVSMNYDALLSSAASSFTMQVIHSDGVNVNERGSVDMRKGFATPSRRAA
jgi:hypothetical protein